MIGSEQQYFVFVDWLAEEPKSATSKTPALAAMHDVEVHNHSGIIMGLLRFLFRQFSSWLGKGDESGSGSCDAHGHSGGAAGADERDTAQYYAEKDLASIPGVDSISGLSSHSAAAHDGMVLTHRRRQEGKESKSSSQSNGGSHTGSAASSSHHHRSVKSASALAERSGESPGSHGSASAAQLLPNGSLQQYASASGGDAEGIGRHLSAEAGRTEETSAATPVIAKASNGVPDRKTSVRFVQVYSLKLIYTVELIIVEAPSSVGHLLSSCFFPLKQFYTSSIAWSLTAFLKTSHSRGTEDTLLLEILPKRSNGLSISLGCLTIGSLLHYTQSHCPHLLLLGTHP